MSANSGRSRMTSSGSGWDLAGLVSEVWLRSCRSGEWGVAEILPVWWVRYISDPAGLVRWVRWGVVEIFADLFLHWQPVTGCQLDEAAVVELAHVSDSGAVGDCWRSRLVAPLLSCHKHNCNCNCCASGSHFYTFATSYR
jgi:hypothetical protein